MLPWGLAGAELGEDVLEIGPGFGATTRVLARRGGSLTVLDESPARLEGAGLIEPSVEAGGRSFRFQARKPPADGASSQPSGTVALAG